MAIEPMTETDLTTLQAKVRQIEIVSKRMVAERMAGEYHSVFKGQGIEFQEVRPYIFGDDIRTIDWNVTARAGTPHVRRYREERELTVFFVVDVSGSCRFGTRGEFKSERMAEITAVLALSAITNNDRVGMLMVTDRLEKVIPPRKGRRHVLRLIRDVLFFQPEGVKTDLAQGLDHLRHVLNRRATVFLISDFLTGQFMPAAAQAFEYMTNGASHHQPPPLATDYEQALGAVARRHDVVAISVEDPMEREIPRAGLLPMIDGESGRMFVMDTSSGALRRRFEQDAEQRRTALRSLLRRREIDHIELTTDQSYEAELVKFFRRRARRMSR